MSVENIEVIHGWECLISHPIKKIKTSKGEQNNDKQRKSNNRGEGSNHA